MIRRRNPLVKECNKCGERKTLDSFRIRSDNGKHRNDCRECERNPPKRKRGRPKGTNQRECDTPTGDTISKRMLSGAKHRAKEKGLAFDLELSDVYIPAICPVLKLPLIPSSEGFLTDNSPTLDRQLPHLGYTKGNVKVISNLANRIKTNANSIQIKAVLEYVKEIEEKQ